MCIGQSDLSWQRKDKGNCETVDGCENNKHKLLPH